LASIAQQLDQNAIADTYHPRISHSVLPASYNLAVLPHGQLNLLHEIDD
jgi:hypothetical protein